MPRHRVVRSLACALRTSPTNAGVMRCVREPHVPPNPPRITRPLPLRRASPAAPLHICETRLLSSCLWLHPAAHPCTAMSKRCCGVASRTYSRSAGQCLGRLRKVLHSLSLRLPTSPFPRPSPQGTPEARPSPILRRLSSTSQSRAALPPPQPSNTACPEPSPCGTPCARLSPILRCVVIPRVAAPRRAPPGAGALRWGGRGAGVCSPAGGAGSVLPGWGRQNAV